jgi:class 3 adenylate cyclase
LTGAAELEAAGLYDPNAPDAAERLALLEYLLGLGATVDDLVEADRDNAFPLVASRIALWGTDPRLTVDEVAERLGVEPAVIRRTWRAAGFPEPEADVPTFAAQDVAMFELLQVAVSIFGEDVVVQLVRVLGAATARIADASISAFFVNVATSAIGRDPSGLELARANTDALALIGGLTTSFDALVRHHIELGFRPAADVAAIEAIDLVHKSVGFADLVGSTSWTRQLDVATLAAALTEFETRASEIIVGHRGRLVKLIGDEVMFVADDPSAAAGVALALIDAFASHEVLPPVRAGIATGEVVARDGDYSGGVVNLAARALSVAEPSTLLVDDATRAVLQDDRRFAVATTREHVLKGFDALVSLSAVTRAG